LSRLPAFLVAFLATSLAMADEPAPNKLLADFFERGYQWFLLQQPEYATFLGDERYNDRLADVSAEAVAVRKAHAREVLAEARSFDAKSLNTQDRISREILVDGLRRDVAFNELYGDLPFGAGQDSWLPIGTQHGPHFLLAVLARSAPFRNGKDYENWLKRLDAIPRQLSQVTAQLEAGIRSGWMPPCEAMLPVPGQLEAFAAGSPEAHPLFAPFLAFPDAIPEAERKRLAAAGTAAIRERVQPAYAKLKAYYDSRYLPACSAELGASTLPGGKAYYALIVMEATTTTLTPEEIHEIGKREVKRIRIEMDKAIAATGHKGTFEEFVAFIRTDKRFYFTTPEQMLAHYSELAKRVDAGLPKLFAVLPRLTFGIRPMDAFAGNNAEHYLAGALDGSRAGFFEVNTNNPATRPIYEFENTLLHEASPGHHLQTARAQELQGLPTFRRVDGNTAYIEGWALYAESLGPELGFYTDPYSRFGALSWEMVRACRLVLDTGLHRYGWKRDEAIKYLAEQSAINVDFAATEIDRYILNPGQALGYKIGELHIKRLRAKAEQALGDKFSIRHFHNAILDDGPLPLTLLEARIDEWIAAERLRAGRS
jgi:uncharacterized protein (DUF885 family)